MLRRHTARAAAAGLLITIGMLAAACTTPTPPPPVNWSFKATSMTVLNVQDEVCDPIFGICVNSEDEPYLYQISFRVKIGEPNSAQTSVVKGSELPETSKNQTRTLTGGQQAALTFNNIQPLDLLEALNPANKLEIFGTYTWAAESDLINSLGPGASATADSLRSALNSTVANSQLPAGDTDSLIRLILNNLGTALNILVSNLPCLGLCDDVLGGAFFIGIGANGSLGQLVDNSLTGFAIPSFALPGDVPPDVQGGGFFTLTGPKSFTQSFSGADGQHRYNFTAAQA